MTRSQVQVLDRPPSARFAAGLFYGDVAQLVRAPALQAGGQEFESPHLHQELYPFIWYNKLMSFEHFVIGSLLVVFGFLALKYNFQLVNLTGNVGFVEQWLGAGSTYGFFKLLSIIICIVGFLYMFGLSNAVFGWLLSPLAQFFPKGNNGL